MSTLFFPVLGSHCSLYSFHCLSRHLLTRPSFQVMSVVKIPPDIRTHQIIRVPETLTLPTTIMAAHLLLANHAFDITPSECILSLLLLCIIMGNMFIRIPATSNLEILSTLMVAKAIRWRTQPNPAARIALLKEDLMCQNTSQQTDLVAHHGWTYPILGRGPLR
jgi:hypothetical protein